MSQCTSSIALTYNATSIRICTATQGDVYALLIAYIGTLRREFDVEKRAYSSSSSSGMTQGQSLRPNEPQYAGSALWACSLAKLAQASWDLLKGCKYMAKHAVRCVENLKEKSSFQLSLLY
jgi:hypothetical protein